MYAGLILLAAALLVTGCGKTVDQLVKIGHDVIDIAGTVYTDLKDDSQAVKDAVVRPEIPEAHNK